MVDGAHVVLFCSDAEAARGFLRDAVGLPSVDAGGGWLIFGLPPAEVACHPADGPARHELYLMCSDLEVTVAGLRSRGATVGDVTEEQWGVVTHVEVPGLGPLGLYEPRHPRAPAGEALSLPAP